MMPGICSQVVLSYGKGGVNHFLSLADQIEDAFPQLLIEGEEVCGFEGGRESMSGRILVCLARVRLRRKV